MHVLKDFPADLDAAALLKRVRIEPDTDDAREFSDLVAAAAARGRPKAGYTEAFVEASATDTVTIGGIVFSSRTLRRNLETVGRVFPYVVTCGHEMDVASPAAGDCLKEFWWDAIKARLLEIARVHLNDHLRTRFRLVKTASMSPGSGDATVWPIEQQAPLFALLGDVTARLGVRLTDSFLMIPNKTVSGIVFPTAKDFRTCQVCHREPCPSRAAPFDPALWEAMQHD